MNVPSHVVEDAGGQDGVRGGQTVDGQTVDGHGDGVSGGGTVASTVQSRYSVISEPLSTAGKVSKAALYEALPT